MWVRFRVATTPFLKIEISSKGAKNNKDIPTRIEVKTFRRHHVIDRLAIKADRVFTGSNKLNELTKQCPLHCVIYSNCKTIAIKFTVRPTNILLKMIIDYMIRRFIK